MHGFIQKLKIIIAKGKILFVEGPCAFHWDDEVGFAIGDRSSSIE
jgi:hypothetical protein